MYLWFTFLKYLDVKTATGKDDFEGPRTRNRRTRDKIVNWPRARIVQELGHSAPLLSPLEWPTAPGYVGKKTSFAPDSVPRRTIGCRSIWLGLASGKKKKRQRQDVNLFRVSSRALLTQRRVLRFLPRLCESCILPRYGQQKYPNCWYFERYDRFSIIIK